MFELFVAFICIVAVGFVLLARQMDKEDED
jgi:hypothetical protein